MPYGGTVKQMKIAVFWDVKLYSQVDSYWCVRGVCYLNFEGRIVSWMWNGGTDIEREYHDQVPE
jgi:hypothetical protein